METNKLIDSLVMEGAQKPLPGLLRQMLFFLLGTIVWLAIFALWNGVRPDMAYKLTEPFYLLELVILFLMAVSAAFAALCLSRPDSYQMTWTRLVPFCFFCVWIVFAFLNMGPMKFPTVAQIMDLRQFHCVKGILILSIPPGIAMFIVVRYGAPIHSLWAGGMTAGAVATFAYLIMRIVEPNDNPFHVLVWHALPVLALCLIGILSGKVLLRWK